MADFETRMTYDQKCYDLALLFLEDLRQEMALPKDLGILGHALAQKIQKTIEDELFLLRCGVLDVKDHIPCPERNNFRTCEREANHCGAHTRFGGTESW